MNLTIKKMTFFQSLLRVLYHNPLVTKMFPTTVSLLQKELSDCHTVLDLGCGPDSPLQYCSHLKKSVGVEAYQPYLKRSQKKHIHAEYINKKIEELSFPEKSFDAVILVEVVEHLPKELGSIIIAKAKKWSKKKVIITTPNGFVKQISLDGNKLQRHLSGWVVTDFENLGFQVSGLSGLKYLRQEVSGNTMGEDLTSSIRFSPKYFWFIIAAISQSLTFHFPRFSFELFCVWKNNGK